MSDPPTKPCRKCGERMIMEDVALTGDGGIIEGWFCLDCRHKEPGPVLRDDPTDPE